MILSIGFPQLIDTGELAPANHLKLLKHKHFIYTRKKMTHRQLVMIAHHADLWCGTTKVHSSHLCIY